MGACNRHVLREGRPRIRRMDDRARRVEQLQGGDQPAVGGQVEGGTHGGSSPEVPEAEHVAAVHRRHMPRNARLAHPLGHDERHRRGAGEGVGLPGIALEGETAPAQADPRAVLTGVIVAPPPRDPDPQRIDALLRQRDRVRRQASVPTGIRLQQSRARGRKHLHVKLASGRVARRLGVQLEHVPSPCREPEPVLVLTLLHRAPHEDGGEASGVFLHVEPTGAQPNRHVAVMVGRRHVPDAISVPIPRDDADGVVVARQGDGLAQGPAHLVEVENQTVASIRAHHHVGSPVRVEVIQR